MHILSLSIFMEVSSMEPLPLCCWFLFVFPPLLRTMPRKPKIFLTYFWWGAVEIDISSDRQISDGSSIFCNAANLYVSSNLPVNRKVTSCQRKAHRILFTCYGDVAELKFHSLTAKGPTNWSSWWQQLPLLPFTWDQFGKADVYHLDHFSELFPNLSHLPYVLPAATVFLPAVFSFASCWFMPLLILRVLRTRGVKLITTPKMLFALWNSFLWCVQKTVALWAEVVCHVIPCLCTSTAVQIRSLLFQQIFQTSPLPTVPFPLWSSLGTQSSFKMEPSKMCSTSHVTSSNC